jgi:hypothetical protein
MKRYGNLSGNSGVLAYEFGSDWIEIKFLDGRIYLYTYESAGQWHVASMKRLAEAGKGLSGYVSQNLHDKGYASKR